MSHRRAIIAAVAAGFFLAVQVVARPFFLDEPESATRTRAIFWALNAGILLLVLATGGGLLNRPGLRALVNDEVAQAHRTTAIAVGYWIAMAIAMALYLIPTFRSFTSRETVYAIVTPSIGVALLAFSYLELRAHRGA